MITHFRKISSKSVYKAACSFQPLEIITANSLSRVVSPWQAVIALNPIISALNHVFQGLAKNSISYSRLRRIIRALGFKFHLHSPYRYCHASLLGHCFSNCPRTFSADHIFLHTVTLCFKLRLYNESGLSEVVRQKYSPLRNCSHFWYILGLGYFFMNLAWQKIWSGAFGSCEHTTDRWAQRNPSQKEITGTFGLAIW